VPRYLSAEWFEHAQRALSENSARVRPTDRPDVVVQQHVTEGPGGDVAYHLEVHDGDVRLEPGVADAPTVTFIKDWETAAAIGKGELSAQGAFMAGRIRVRGDLPKLVECSDVFGELDDVLADLRSQTTY